ncbi:MAG: hypothetical protein LR015_07980 [Verrucomicrobia bacterium]|nr:hypothetical protein [Verrucomicrobiota bacterium]
MQIQFGMKKDIQMTTLKPYLIATILVLASSLAAQSVIFSTLGNPGGDELAGVNDWVILGSPFQTDDTLYNTISGTVVMRFGSNETALVSVWSNSASNTPGTQLFSFDPIQGVDASSMQQYSLTTSALNTLQPNGIYWLVLQGTTSTQLPVNRSSSNNFTGAGSLPFPYLAIGYNGGTTWDISPNMNPLTFEIAAIPEPATVVTIFGLCALALAGLRRNKDCNHR